jgi:hypothetical protein
MFSRFATKIIVPLTLFGAQMLKVLETKCSFQNFSFFLTVLDWDDAV